MAQPQCRSRQTDKGGRNRGVLDPNITFYRIGADHNRQGRVFLRTHYGWRAWGERRQKLRLGNGNKLPGF